MDIKSFIIRVSANQERVEFHTMNSLVVPALPFVLGSDRFSLKSNVPNIVKHVQDMMRVEGFNHVTCIKSDLAVYNEVIADLRHIDGLRVTVTTI